MINSLNGGGELVRKSPVVHYNLSQPTVEIMKRRMSKV